MHMSSAKKKAADDRRDVERAMRIGFGAIALCALLAAPALAADPLACDDERMLQQVRDNLQDPGGNAQPPRKLVELKEPLEVQLGAPPPSASQYATATTYIAISRYCEGRAEFETGEPE